MHQWSFESKRAHGVSRWGELFDLRVSHLYRASIYRVLILVRGAIRSDFLPVRLQVPSGLCKQSAPGVFSRAYTKYHVGLDCNTFTATLSPKTDPIA